MSELEKACHEFRLEIYKIYNMKFAYTAELGIEVGE
jgi:hypothetical protein